MGVTYSSLTTKLDSELNSNQLSSGERRDQKSRRTIPARSLNANGVPGRRRLLRRTDDTQNHTDWYETHVMLIALSIVVFCILDFIFTSVIIASGGIELNFLMREAISSSLESFFIYKYSLTSLSLFILVVHQNYKLFRLLKVRYVLYSFALGYAVLIAYEVVLISKITV